MQKTTSSIITKIASHSTSILKATLFLAIAFGLSGSVGIQKTEAATSSNYFVDLTGGNGCGNNCTDFQNFLAANGITTTSSTGGNSSNTNTNGGNTTGTGTIASGTSASPYPYQTYTNFPSTNAFYQKIADYNKNYVSMPAQTYSYYQDPSAKPDSAASGQYPESYYVYYGTDATTQMGKYTKTYKPTVSANNTNSTNGSSNSGFTITSIR